MTPLIIFDDGKGQFGPMTDLRAPFELRTGVVTTAQRIAACRPGQSVSYWVPQRLQAVVAERANAPVNEVPAADAVLCVNGRCVLPTAMTDVARGSAVVEAQSGDVVAALLSRADAHSLLNDGALSKSIARREAPAGTLCRYPWHILASLPKALARDLATMPSGHGQPIANVAAFGQHPISIHPTAMICPGVVLDAQHGPIMVHERAVIRPGAVLCGPCSIGADSTIVDRALIKANTAVGPWCKVAGEVGATIFQGFANKAHDGHLGDSWVGEWVNFGAGTTNSNLLNTYGEVTMRLEPDGPRHRTGTSFLGAIVGDHAKFAICTRIMTGTVIGTGAMIASSAPPPTTVKRFAWITDDGERQFRLDKFLEIMTTVMARRQQTPGPAYIDAVRTLHARANVP